MSDEVADLIDSGADLIDKYGHIKGTYGDPSIGFCEIGSLLQVVDDAEQKGDNQNPTLGKALYALGREIKKCACGEEGCKNVSVFHQIVVWNDAEERTQQEVLDHMRLVAKKERGLDV